ncbi:MAG TPA: glycosyltransferase family A protein [Pseudothermotoga sp.]
MLFLFEQLLLIVSWIIGWMIFAKPKFLKRQEPLIFPSVSVIIPARNEETNIAKIIRLLKEQTYKNFQIIVVNDNSTDKTRDVVLSFKYEHLTLPFNMVVVGSTGSFSILNLARSLPTMDIV